MYKYVFALMLIPAYFVTAEEQSHNYSQIRQLNMASLLWEDEEWPNESFYDYLHRFFDYQVNMQKSKKRRTVFKLFEGLESKQSAWHNALYDAITAQDLLLFAGKAQKDPYVAGIIDRTNTELGKVAFYGLIGYPITDIKELCNRQEIIKYLLIDPAFLAQCMDLYQRLGSSENLVLSLWQQDGFVNITERRYFSIPYFSRINKALNTTPLLLECRSLLGHQERALWWGTGIAAIGLLSTYGISRLARLSVPNLFERMALRLQGTGGRLIALLSSLESPWLDVGALSLLSAIFCGFSCKEDYEWLRDNVILDLLLQKKMITVAHFFRAIMELNELLEKHPDFIKRCPAAAQINDFMNNEACSGSMQQLLEFCQTSTLQGDESFFSYHGRVLAAFKLAYACKETIEPLLLAVGELDASIACACLFNEFKDKRVPFCFVQYAQEKDPVIRMHDFWNPMIDPERVVANDIELHGPEKRDMIITGPNAGGKSTLIKAIPINLIFAQTIGMAAARFAEITPFATIATYLNIVDDIAAGNSLFKAQVLRAQEMVNLVEKMPAHQFSFVALDEMFNGTSANESMAAAFSVVNHIGNSANNICIVATHFPLLTKLEEKSPAFQNYKVSVHVDEKGIHYPFKLEKGISHQHIALDILKQEGYDCKILDEASQILNDVTVIAH
jgi:hypothetical protein